MYSICIYIYYVHVCFEAEIFTLEIFLHNTFGSFSRIQYSTGIRTVFLNKFNIIINPRRACARVTVLVLSVCLCVCFPYSGTSRNQAYKQQYQRLQRDTGMKYKKGFFFKTLRSEVMASFTHLE